MIKIFKKILMIFYAPVLILWFFNAFFYRRKKRKHLSAKVIEKGYKKFDKLSRRIGFLIDLKVKLNNYEDLPKKCGLIVSNHQSYIDAIIVFRFCYKKNIYPVFIAKSEVKKNLFYRCFVSFIDVIYIERNNLRQSYEAFLLAKKCLNETKRHVVIFPEGTASYTSVLNPFKPGAFKIATNSHSPLYLLVIQNSYHRFSPKSRRKPNISYNPKIIASVKLEKIVKPAIFQQYSGPILSNRIFEFYKKKLPQQPK